MAKPHFRVGVVAAVRRADGRLLVFERSDHSGQWQLPQGGVEPGETLREAVWRELEEETGLNAHQVALVDEYEGWTAYMWPEEMRRRERFGQAHRWFFFEPLSESVAPSPDGSEFRNWKWMEPEQLIERVIEFRKQPYRQVLDA